jgi:ATP-dependent Lon protease
MAAARAGVTTVLLPRRNEKDLVEVPQEVLEKLEIVSIDSIDEALERALEGASAA